MSNVFESPGLPKVRKVGKTFYVGESKVVFLESATPEEKQALIDAGFFPIDVDELRTDVVKGNKARNLLKVLGLEIPTNSEYFKSARDQEHQA